jgi:hypothetical protein
MAFGRPNLPQDAFKRASVLNEINLVDFLRTRLHNIRHHAVHRVETPVSELKDMLANAELLSDSLRDTPRAAKLHALAVALESEDAKRIGSVIARPLSTFVEVIDLSAQDLSSGSLVPQKENLPPGTGGMHKESSVQHAIEDMSGLEVSSGALIESIEGEGNVG